MRHQLVLQFPGELVTDFDALIEFEDMLTLTLGEAHRLVGHDFGADMMNIFIATDDPDAAFAAAYGQLAPPLKDVLRAAHRPRGDGQEFEWVYPPDPPNAFRLD